MKCTILLLILLFIGSFLPLAYCNDHSSFSQSSLQVDGKIQDVFLEDLNGDFVLDLLVLHNIQDFPSPKVKRYISVFIQKDRQFPEKPTMSWIADQGEIIFDVGYLDEDAFPELVFITQWGVLIRQFRGDRYSELLPLIEVKSIFIAPAEKRLIRWPILMDVNHDHVPEILVPQAQECRVYGLIPDRGYDLLQRLWTSPQPQITKNNPLSYSLNLPVYQSWDFNSDDVLDFLVLSGESFDVFLTHPQEKRNIIPLTPPNLRFHMGIRNLSEGALERLAPGTVKLEAFDLNIDGWVDIILTKASRASFTKNISHLQVYMNKQGRFDALPDYLLTSENFGGEHIISDFNQDGLLDIALLTFKIGFPQAVRFLLTRRAGNSFDCYYMREDHTYPMTPDEKLTFTRNVDLGAIIGTGLCHTCEADFTGDGLKDLIIGTNTEEFTIYPGSEEGFFTKKNTIKLKVPVTPTQVVADINNDGMADLVLWYPDEETARSNLINLMISQKVTYP